MLRNRLPAMPVVALSLIAALATALPALAGGFVQLGAVVLPGAPLAQFDISYFDPGTGSYYLADRSNSRVDVIGRRGAPRRSIGAGLFTGWNGDHTVAGPDGVAVVSRRGRRELWAADGDSTVKVFDLPAGRLLHTIDTGGTKRADEMVFDARDQLLVVANDSDSPPYLSFISTRAHRVVARLPFPRATNGLEQPVYDPLTGLVLQAVPELDGNHATGEIAVIDPRTARQVGSFPVSQCEPAGLALGAGQRLAVGCSSDAIAAGFPAQALVLDARSGTVLKAIGQFGGSDQVWYDPGAERFYFAANGNPAGPVLGIVSAESLRWVASVPTSAGSHSVAADPETQHVFVPLSAPSAACPTAAQGCVGIFGERDDE
jgi:DNA-binding beta-propeller fold protein YncE